MKVGYARLPVIEVRPEVIVQVKFGARMTVAFYTSATAGGQEAIPKTQTLVGIRMTHKDCH